MRMSSVDYLDELIARSVLISDDRLDEHSEQRCLREPGEPQSCPAGPKLTLADPPTMTHIESTRRSDE
jgi:hypothetical protein